MRFAPILALFAQLAGVTNAALDYLNPPELQTEWTNPHEGVAIGSGNAVATSPQSDSIVAVNSDGSVSWLGPGYASDPFAATYTQPPIGDGSTVSSTSGVSFYTLEGTEYIVYAVKDQPGAGASFSSRIVSLAVGSSEEAWSTIVTGEVAGTPVVGSDNEHIYVTHNDPDGNGHFTVLSISGEGSKVFEEIGLAIGTSGPFAPVGIAHQPDPWANYAQGFRNRNDFVAWGHMNGGVVSGAVSGWMYGFQLPRSDQPDAQPSIILLQEGVGWVTSTKPVFSIDGQSMIFSVSAGLRKGAETRAWVDGKNFGTGAAYKGTYSKEGGEPPSTPGALSIDETMFYFPSTAASITGTNFTNGEMIWEDVMLPGIVKVQPVSSPDGDRIYFLTDDGSLFGKDAKTGETLWKLELSPGSATADLSINEEGTLLRYGVTFFGEPASTKYYEVKLGSPMVPTAPTAVPPVPAPGSEPVSAPVDSPAESPVDTPTVEPLTPSAASFQTARLALVSGTFGLLMTMTLW